MVVDKNFDWSDYEIVGGEDLSEEPKGKQCNMCGRAIYHVYILENSLGDTKYLGCECVKKRFKKVKITMDYKSFSKKSIAKLKRAGIEIEEEVPF